MSACVLRVAVIALVLVTLNVSAVRAQGTTTPLGSPSLNYAFATQLGSGIYRVSDRTLQVYRINVTFNVYEPAEHKWRLRLGLPLTLGIYDFKISELLDPAVVDFPDRVATLALVPQLEFQYPLRDHVWLIPYGGFGPGEDFTSGGGLNWIYALGTRLLAIFPWKDGNVRGGARLVYTGYTEKNLDFIDDFAFLETGVDARRPVFKVKGYDINASGFVANYIYFISPHIISNLLPDPAELRTEWEIGTTVGTKQPWRVLGVRMPRLGISYRFGSGAEAWRFIIGNPLPIDAPTDKGPGFQ